MGKHSTGPRVPEAFEGIQFNHCKNPRCINYGTPASSERQPRGKGAKDRGRDPYKLSSSKIGKNRPTLECQHGSCKKSFTMKSNKAIHEELTRMSAYLEPKPVTCPNKSCSNYGISIKNGKDSYHAFGKTKTGSKRYRCKECGKTFSIGSSISRQLESHLNPIIFKLLVNKMPFQRICEVCDISFSTLLGKIDFFYEQCVAFAANREKELLNGKEIDKVVIAVDRQDYIINWGNAEDRRNVVLHGVGSADNITGYVFGIHIDYDHTLDALEIEKDAINCGDYDKKYPFRKYARVFLQKDYFDSCMDNPGEADPRRKSVASKIKDRAENFQDRDDPEVSSYHDSDMQLPVAGMQVHGEYTVIAHFFFLKKLLSGAKRIHFALDQDPGMQGGVLAAFIDEVMDKRCDALLVSINKSLNNIEKLALKNQGNHELEKLSEKYPMVRKSDLRMMLFEERVKDPVVIKGIPWVMHPFPNMAEPEKATHHLTDLGGREYTAEQLAKLHDETSLHAIDLFFMQARRRISLLERAISTPSSKGKRWYGYSAYNPVRIVKLVEILRVYYNYVLPTEDIPDPKKRTRLKIGPTRAEKLGLMRGRADVKDIIYFVEK